MTKTQILEQMNSFRGYNYHNGIRIIDFGKDFAVVEGKLRPEALNPLNIAHGGFVYSMCDTAAGVAVGVTGRSCVTLSSNIHYLRPSTGSALRAEGRIIKDGSHIVMVESTVTDESGSVTAKACFELFIKERRS